MSEKTRENDQEPVSSLISKHAPKGRHLALATKKIKASLKNDKAVEIDEMVCKFFAKAGLPSETVRDPAFIQLIYTLNKNYSPPTPSTVDYELDVIAHQIVADKRSGDLRKFVQPIAITVDTLKNEGGVFLAFSLHYYNNGTTRENIVKLVKMTSLELDPVSVLQKVQSAANQFCLSKIRFPSLITTNPEIAQYFHEVNIIDRSYECYFTYITNFADEILKIPEFNIALDVLTNFYIEVLNDVKFQERIEQYFTTNKMVFEIPKMNISKWTDVSEFLSGVLQYHRFIVHVSVNSNNHKMYIDEHSYQQLMGLQMILSFLMKSVNELSKSESYCSEVLPEIVKIRNLIMQDVYDDNLKTTFEEIFTRTLDPLTRNYKNGVYDLATFLDPRFAFLSDVFSDETWKTLSNFVRENIMNSNVGSNLSYSEKLGYVDVELHNFKSMVQKQRPTSHPFNWWKIYSTTFSFLYDAARNFITPPPCAINAEYYFGDCGKYRNIENKISFKQFNNNLAIASSLEPFRGRGLFEENELFGIKQGSIVQVQTLRKKQTTYEKVNLQNDEDSRIDLSKYLMLPPEKEKEGPLDLDEILEPEVKPETLELPENENEIETIKVKEELIDIKPEEIEIPDANTPSTSTPKQISVSARTENVDVANLTVNRRVYIRVPYQRTAMERALKKAPTGEQSTNLQIEYLLPSSSSSSSSNNNNAKNIQLKRPQESTSNGIVIESSKRYKRVCTNFETENGVICKERIHPFYTSTSFENVTIARPQKMCKTRRHLSGPVFCCHSNKAFHFPIDQAMFLIFLPLISLISTLAANDDLYILIDEISLYNCRGIKNEIKVSEDDVQIVNELGNRVYYIRAPGNYSLDFKKIKVAKNFGYLAGEIGVTLQVPIIEGPAGIRFDLPYTMIPETSLLSQKCDDNSGIVERNGRTYCRYCDLCQVSEAVEKELSNGQHQFLSRSAGDTPISKCHNIEANEYDFRRTIQLPSRSQLENLIKSKAQGIDDEIKKRLNKGRGRFQVFLNLIASEKPAISKARWFAGSKDCECCFNRNAENCDSLSYFYCNMEDCKTGWALQCLHNTARIAACYTVEFNYRMTTQYSDVQQFLKENNYPNQDAYSSNPTNYESQTLPPTPKTTTQSAEARQVDQIQMSRACVEAMSPRLTHLRRYCTIFWNEKLCCEHCPDIC
ncbi:unnamed protein product [Caenorhabditis angaria]|uniref:Uncharacterized protein n=1 Tax=Caenorhabditis angaria TaxID=860376 RepID=A0A9P1ITJ5_9PELO|nr:unnamed protein product [Caenorhabditis angaria]